MEQKVVCDTLCCMVSIFATVIVKTRLPSKTADSCVGWKTKQTKISNGKFKRVHNKIKEIYKFSQK